MKHRHKKKKTAMRIRPRQGKKKSSAGTGFTYEVTFQKGLKIQVLAATTGQISKFLEVPERLCLGIRYGLDH